MSRKSKVSKSVNTKTYLDYIFSPSNTNKNPAIAGFFQPQETPYAGSDGTMTLKFVELTEYGDEWYN